jgi:hypothetical protein
MALQAKAETERQQQQQQQLQEEEEEEEGTATPPSLQVEGVAWAARSSTLPSAGAEGAAPRCHRG